MTLLTKVAALAGSLVLASASAFAQDKGFEMPTVEVANVAQCGLGDAFGFASQIIRSSIPGINIDEQNYNTVIYTAPVEGMKGLGIELVDETLDENFSLCQAMTASSQQKIPVSVTSTENPNTIISLMADPKRGLMLQLIQIDPSEPSEPSEPSGEKQVLKPGDLAI